MIYNKTNYVYLEMTSLLSAFVAEVYESHVKEHGITKTDKNLIEYVINQIENNKKKEIVIFGFPDSLNGKKITSNQTKRILIEIINKFKQVATFFYVTKSDIRIDGIFYYYDPMSQKKLDEYNFDKDIHFYIIKFKNCNNTLLDQGFGEIRPTVFRKIGYTLNSHNEVDLW